MLKNNFCISFSEKKHLNATYYWIVMIVEENAFILKGC